jgi:adenylate kinase
MNIVIFGPPGAGKGTQSKFLREKYGFVQLSTGDLVRAEMTAGTDTGKLLKEIVGKGKLPSDELIINLVKKVYDPGKKGYLFDGFPRTINQATVLVNMLAEFHQKIDCVFNLIISDETVKKRMLGRYSCKTCGAIYNRYFKNPHKEGVCDVCQGTDFTNRTDDTEEAIQTRLRTYDQITKPVLAYLKQKTEVIEIDGEQDFDVIKNQIESRVSKILSKEQGVKCAHS